MRLPGDSHHHLVVGTNGSGKTQAGIWSLSRRSITRRPWIVYDFKGDELINEIPYAQHIELKDVPEKPGVYITHPHPDDIIPVRMQMRRIWERGNIGVFCDEGYMICNPQSPNPEFRSILTQGRSKHIPVIILSQRPVWLDRFCFSEASFFQAFRLNDKRDRQVMGSFMADADLNERLPDFHSWFYDVPDNKLVICKPVPDKPDILSVFEQRLQPKKETVHFI